MKILIVGASGIIGSALKEALTEKHEVIAATFKSAGDVKVDIQNKQSIEKMFETIGPVDAIVSTAGFGSLKPIDQLDDADFDLVWKDKVMGQINLLRVGRHYLNKGGSVTLTTGLAANQPMPGTGTISLACAGLEGFMRAAALEISDLRVNCVSPAMVKETMVLFGFEGDHGISAADTAKAYVAAIEGDMSGQVLETTAFAEI